MVHVLCFRKHREQQARRDDIDNGSYKRYGEYRTPLIDEKILTTNAVAYLGREHTNQRGVGMELLRRLNVAAGKYLLQRKQQRAEDLE
jgi:hypothetical protein